MLRHSGVSFEFQAALETRRFQNQPARRIFNHSKGFSLLEYGVGLVTRAEIKHTSTSNPPNQSAAEVFAFVPLFLEDNFVRDRYVKMFAVHLSLRDVPLGW